MSYYRSYFEKNNTILKNSSTINTAKNPATDIYYGYGFSKFIFKVDFTELITKINNGDLVLTSGTTHTLHLTNCIFGEETFLGAQRGTGKDRASSFDLILFKIPEYWDEGVGFDYDESNMDINITTTTYNTTPSNWDYATTLSGWTIPGIYDTTPDIITTIHFDNGNENINVDITDYVNSVLSGTTDYGLGLAFSLPYQNIVLDNDLSVSFFTKYTQTFFEPYVESFFNDRITDNRLNFYEGVLQKLYLYVTKGSSYYDLDVLPTVDIYDNNNAIITSLTGLTTTKIRKGVYEVSFGLSGVTCPDKCFFKDVWKGIQIDGISTNNITQKFIPVPFDNGYNIGAYQKDTKRYAIRVFGISQNEKIIRGDIRKLLTEFKSIEDRIPDLIDNVYYRLYIKEGNTDVIVHDWTLIDKAGENFVMIDTSYLIPREYYLDIKAKTNSEIINYNKPIKFEIISER